MSEIEKKRKRCFVIGLIGSPDSSTRKRSDILLRFIIRPAISGEGLDYDIKRADEMSRPGMITHDVIDAARHWELAVVDMSGLNANAFYEMAIRHAVGLPTVHMIDEETEIPFDLKDVRAIRFRTDDADRMEAATKELRAQVLDTQRPEYNTANPITVAINLEKLASSDNALANTVFSVAENVMELGSRIERLELHKRAESNRQILAERGVLSGLLSRGPSGLLGSGIKSAPTLLTADTDELAKMLLSGVKHKENEDNDEDDDNNGTPKF